MKKDILDFLVEHKTQWRFTVYDTIVLRKIQYLPSPEERIVALILSELSCHYQNIEYVIHPVVFQDNMTRRATRFISDAATIKEESDSATVTVNVLTLFSLKTRDELNTLYNFFWATEQFLNLVEQDVALSLFYNKKSKNIDIQGMFKTPDNQIFEHSEISDAAQALIDNNLSVQQWGVSLGKSLQLAGKNKGNIVISKKHFLTKERPLTLFSEIED
jgi:hypothetical protein